MTILPEFDRERFYIGKLCLRGHDFGGGRSLRKKNNYSCVVCLKENVAKYRRKEDKKEKIRSSLKAYKSSERGRQVNREYQKTEKRKVYLEKYRCSDSRKAVVSRYQKSPKGKISKASVSAVRRARKKKAHCVNYSNEQIQERFAEFDNKCAYCKSPNRLTIDHVMPICKGGPDVIGNIVPACKRCNSSKHGSEMLEWYKIQSFFSEKQLVKLLKVLGKTRNTCNQLPLF